APPRLNVGFVVNAALFVKTLKVRQQGGLRELHRLWCWPQRSSHGQDQLGYRPCTLTRGPAPKSTQPCFMSQSSLSYFFLRKLRGEVLKKVRSSLSFVVALVIENEKQEGTWRCITHGQNTTQTRV